MGQSAPPTASSRPAPSTSASEVSPHNYVVASRHWDDGLASDFGAVTWGSGTTGVHGAVSAANSLVGTVTTDQVGILDQFLNGATGHAGPGTNLGH
jgi:Repeat of unknown function (DUF5650)